MAFTTYLDFAEDDYKYLIETYEDGYIANRMPADAQNICEKYLKHIIDTYYIPINEEESINLEHIMKSHNLTKLINFLENDMDIEIPEYAKDDIEKVNGFYYTVRYPGDDSLEATPKNIEDSIKAIKACRTFAKETIIELENEILKNDKKIDDGDDLRS